MHNKWSEIRAFQVKLKKKKKKKNPIEILEFIMFLNTWNSVEEIQ